MSLLVRRRLFLASMNWTEEVCNGSKQATMLQHYVLVWSWMRRSVCFSVDARFVCTTGCLTYLDVLGNVAGHVAASRLLGSIMSSSLLSRFSAQSCWPSFSFSTFPTISEGHDGGLTGLRNLPRGATERALPPRTRRPKRFRICAGSEQTGQD